METKYFKSSAGKIRYVDTGIKNQNNETILLISGWSETIEAVSSTIKKFSEEGYRVIAMDYAHLDPFVRDSNGLPQAEYVKTVAISQLIKKLGIVKYNIIAHSEGAIIGSILALDNEASVRSLMLVAPAGLMIQDSFLKISWRFVWYLLSQFKLYFTGVYASAFKYLRGVIVYALTNPIQVINEAIGITNFNLLELIKKVDQKNVTICIIYDEEDNVFPAKIVGENIHTIDIKTIVSTTGGHNSLNIYPEKFIKIFKNLEYVA